MPSYSQEINVDLNSNESDANKMKDDKNNENRNERYVETNQINAPQGLNTDQRLAFALRDFLSPPNATGVGSLDTIETLPFIDDAVDTVQSENEQVQSRDADEVLNNAACRLRRWRAVSRKLRRPRIIDNLSKTEEKDGHVRKACNGSHTDLADRLRSLAVAGSLSASAGELLSLAPPPPGAMAPPSPGCLLSPSLADQSSVDYFVSYLHKYYFYIGLGKS